MGLSLGFRLGTSLLAPLALPRRAVSPYLVNFPCGSVGVRTFLPLPSIFSTVFYPFFKLAVSCAEFLELSFTSLRIRQLAVGFVVDKFPGSPIFGCQ